jgi:hypothetical protein
VNSISEAIKVVVDELEGIPFFSDSNRARIEDLQHEKERLEGKLTYCIKGVVLTTYYRH